jgi:hypothetical protein
MHYPLPDPNLEQIEEGVWKCKRCGGINWCSCLGGVVDPICDCGHLAFDCRCADIDYLESEDPVEDEDEDLDYYLNLEREDRKEPCRELQTN